MKKKSQKKSEFVAVLTINEMPRTKESEDRLVEWLRLKAKELKKANPDEYTEPCRFRLMR